MNEPTQLTTDEIEKLFDFVTSKYVRYEDLKYELVDHLASSIEEIQATNPEKSFDIALKETYKRFPITGFTNFVAEKQKSLYRYWNKQVLNYLVQFFKLPKIILLFTLVFCIWTLFQYIPHIYILGFSYLAIIIDFVLNMKHVIVKRKMAQKYLFLESYNMLTVGNFYLLIFIPLQVSTRSSSFSEIVFSPVVAILFSVFVAFTFIVSYFTTKVLPQKLREEVNNKYKHLNIDLAI